MNKMTFIGLIGLTVVACQSNTEGYQIKGNIEGAGNGVAILTLPVGREEPTTGDTVKSNRHPWVSLERTTRLLLPVNGLTLSINTATGIYRMFK